MSHVAVSRAGRALVLLAALSGAVVCSGSEDSGLAFPVVRGEPPRHVGPLTWTTLEDVAHLKREVEAARGTGKAVVVAVWATWCKYCRMYQELIDADPELKEGLSHFVRLQIEVTDDTRADLRGALGMPLDTQPFMVFLDRHARIVRSADVKQWHNLESAPVLWRSLVRTLASGPADAGPESAGDR